jgi:hypothetical protein
MPDHVHLFASPGEECCQFDALGQILESSGVEEGLRRFMALAESLV